MKCVLFGLAALSLTACGETGFQLPSLAGPQGESRTQVTRDAISLSGSRGFCVDPVTSRRAPESAFIVFGNCAAITGSIRAPQPAVNAIVTTTVRSADPSVPRITQSSEQLARFFDSDVGHILISRDNTSESVTVKESGATKDGAFFLYIEDTSDGAPEGTSDTYWRSYFDIKDSLVTVSVLSIETSPLSRDTGLDILRSFTSRIQSDPENARVVAVEAAPQQDVETRNTSTTRPIQRPEQDAPDTPAQKPHGLFGRLFG